MPEKSPLIIIESNLVPVYHIRCYTDMRYSRVFPIAMQHCSTYKLQVQTKTMWIFGKLKVLSNVRQ